MFKNQRLIFAIFIATLCFVPVAIFAQSKRRKPPANLAVPTAASTPKPDVTVIAVPEQNLRGKRNERPGSGAGGTGKAVTVEASKPVYFYEFTHPYYLVRKVIIEHDQNGKGKISFMKGGYTEPITDPLEVSPAAMERLRTAYAALNFLDSNENYQYEKDMPHLGVMKITLRKDGRERSSEFNWTVNKDAKAITDEYRKLGNQYIWMFDVNLARENQPLQAPGLMDELDSLLRQKGVSDPMQMLPFLQKLTLDERIPLIARNHATKIIAAIEKQAAKDAK
ncbi:MAG: hypothetical protein ABI791_02135 [Acidobacteriota bacterium]